MGFNTRIMMLIGILLLVVGPSTACAEELINGRYLSASGKEIRIELAIGSPAPASVIVIQQLPKGIGVISSSPDLKMYNQDTGNAKWLLSKVSSGKMLLSMTLGRAITEGDVYGEIRCRDTAGRMITTPLTK